MVRRQLAKAAESGARPEKVRPEKVRPSELARRWGVKVHTILKYIRAGDLRAIDASTSPATAPRPRFLIDEKDIEDFEERRRV